MHGKKIRLMIMDDEVAFRELLVRRFARSEFEVTGCKSGEEALELARSGSFDVGVLDIRMPGISGIDLLREIKTLQPDFEAIMLTGLATIDSAIEAMKIGAYDYLAKPCKLFELEIIVRKAYEKKILAEQNTRLRDELKLKDDQRELVGSSVVMQALLEEIANVAAQTGSALIHGEAGVGKELVAWSIHKASARKDNSFITVNCGVLSEGKLETELFGHEADAFVGAGMRKRGIIENAADGSVLLDEVEQLSPSMQVKILHFLDTGEFRRVGGFSEMRSGARLLFATTEDLLRQAQNGKFREDFYYKISSSLVSVPPLREHKEDIPEIAEYIIHRSNLAASRNKRLAKKAMEALLKYDWPSNTRELVNVLERAVSLAPKNVIQMKNLPISFEKKLKPSKQRHLQSLAKIEKEHILHVLDAVNSNISKASRILGISRPKLYRKLEKYKSGSGA
ncbi:Response regulator of zinc sigma-54-dependent two-component system [hydrothermal vent metagenome]|uniref:Response regulator of zinc sigma-54-dependent two-component system n=1 Tax=hydrothermal vent metagenome TaxID=652676 RepID=A0A3B1BLN2_9ZZZZ